MQRLFNQLFELKLVQMDSLQYSILLVSALLQRLARVWLVKKTSLLLQYFENFLYARYSY